MTNVNSLFHVNLFLTGEVSTTQRTHAFLVYLIDPSKWQNIDFMGKKYKQRKCLNKWKSETHANLEQSEINWILIG